MKNVNSFSLSTLDDKSLGALYADVCHEINARAEAKAAKREQWVRTMVNRYLYHSHSASKQIGKITIVSVYDDYYSGVSIGTSRPVNNDKFDEDVGIAVAFAKAIGEPIPDYI